MEPLSDKLGQAYAQALLAIARVDREIAPEEASRVRELVATRSSVVVDFEASFFERFTPEALVAAAKEANADGAKLGRALVADGVSLATSDGDLNSAEAQTILRFARALGCSDSDVAAETRELGEWL